jgi:hypothetical protein
MREKLIRYSVITFAYAAVAYPLWTRLKTLSWSLDSSLLSGLFPVFGIIAFCILWLHAISGVFEPWLRQRFDFDKFVRISSTIVFLSIILHPLFLLMGLGFSYGKLMLYGKYVWYGIVGWILLMTYDVGKALIRYEFFSRNWNKILTVSTIGFLITFFHSLNIGSDLQTQPLRGIWIFYGTTAILATIYTYGIKRKALSGVPIK